MAKYSKSLQVGSFIKCIHSSGAHLTEGAHYEVRKIIGSGPDAISVIVRNDIGNAEEYGLSRFAERPDPEEEALPKHTEFKMRADIMCALISAGLVPNGQQSVENYIAHIVEVSEVLFDSIESTVNDGE